MHSHSKPGNPARAGPSRRNIWHAINYWSVIRILLAIGATALPFVLWVWLG